MRYGAGVDPPNRFLKTHAAPDLDQVAWDDEYLRQRDERPIVYQPDAAQSIVSENDSPDVYFRYSVNPYRGCVHGCSYCYARNTHEYLGLSAGLDFETQIFVKHEAPRLLAEFLARPKWRPELIVFSGVTDCYQPAEREFRLTRGCLEVARDFRQPIGIITKNALVTRDLDLLAELATQKLVQVSISVTTLDVELARKLEPRTSIPAARLRAIELLSQAGVPVRVMVAPLIPGLNDHEAPQVLEAARAAGATDARYNLLRLPLQVEPIFRDWLRRNEPLKKAKVEGLIRSTRDGRLNDTATGRRMVGQGEIANQVQQLFRLFRTKLGFVDLPPLDFSRFAPPPTKRGQLRLF